MTGAEPYSAYQQDRGFVFVRPVQAARFFVCTRGSGQSAVQYGSVCFRFSSGGPIRLPFLPGVRISYRASGNPMPPPNTPAPIKQPHPEHTRVRDGFALGRS